MVTKFQECLPMLRMARGYTQLQMADKLGIPCSAYIEYETGDRMPELEMVVRIAGVLDCTMDELLGNSAEESSQSSDMEGGAHRATRNLKSKRYQFFCHKECEFFPCHKTKDTENFNCLFCYCPLYALGERCGGNFRYTDKGVKDCKNCLLPHKRENFGYITGKFSELKELTERNRTEKK